MMSPPRPLCLCVKQPSSITQPCAGNSFLLKPRQPEVVFPSKRSFHPSLFSAGVSSLSLAGPGRSAAPSWAAIKNARTSTVPGATNLNNRCLILEMFIVVQNLHLRACVPRLLEVLAHMVHDAAV